MVLIGLEVDIYEQGMDYPIVRHVFIGRTKEEALSYFKAHLGTDEFLRGCSTDGKWENVRCGTAEARFMFMEM